MKPVAHYRLLLLEDDKEDVFLLREYLENLKVAKFDIEQYSTIEGLLAALDEDAYDIILSDLNVRDSKGLETLDRIFEASSALPVIVMTGLDDRETGLRAMSKGAQDYLTKGKFDPDQLLQSIEYSISRKQTEDNFRKSTELMKYIFDETPLILLLVNKELEVVMTNHALRQLHGKSEKELTGKLIGDVLQCLTRMDQANDCRENPDCRDCIIRQSVENAFSKRSSIRDHQVSLKLVRNKKVIEKQFLLSASAVNTAEEMVIVGLNDITEQERAREIISQQKRTLQIQLDISDHQPENMQDLMHFSLDSVLELTQSKAGLIGLYDESSEMLDIHACSEEIKEVFGLTHEITMKHKSELGELASIIDELKPQYVNHIAGSKSDKTIFNNENFAVSRYLGVPIESDKVASGLILLVNKTLPYNSADIQQGSLVADSIQRSIEREQLFEELKAAKKKAEESDRLKSAFLANMSHEIRTPMNGILGFAKLLEKPGLTPEKQGQYIEMILQGGQRLLNIINDLIDISKIESGLMKTSFSETNINQQTNYVYHLLNNEAKEKGVQLSLHNGMDDRRATVITDKEKLYAILTNLVKNAVKYTLEGSIELGYVLDKDMVMFYVTDTGVGIEKAAQKLIFERFIQADQEFNKHFEGAGLGLALTKAFVEMLGGTIWLKSQLGMGSTFFFTLPYDPVHPARKESEAPGLDVQYNSLANARLLVIEDEKASALYLEEILAPQCMDLHYASDGKEAMKKILGEKPYDLILMDIKMPRMDGYETIKKIREFDQSTPIIAQTAYALEGDREKALGLGFTDYLSKPVDPGDILQLVNKYLLKE